MNKIILLLFLFMSFNLYSETGAITGLDIPRFVSLKSNDVNLRVGPSKNYPIEIKYTKKNLPIEIIDEFDAWRKTRDFENNIGWLHKSLIKGDRYILTGVVNIENTKFYNRPSGVKIGLIEKKNILKLNRCLLNWCHFENNGISGWILKDEVWGVYKNELYNKSFFQPIINQYWRILDNKYLN